MTVLYLNLCYNEVCYKTGLQIRFCTGKVFFLFFNQNIRCEYSKDTSQCMFKLMGKEINAILGAQTFFIWTYDNGTALHGLFVYTQG